MVRIRILIFFLVVVLGAVRAEGTGWIFPSVVARGEVFRVLGPKKAVDSYSIRFGGARYSFLPFGERSYVLIPVSRETQPGWARVRIYDVADGSLAKAFRIRIAQKKYPRYSYRMASTERIERNRAIAREEWKRFEPILQRVSAKRHWSGLFTRPVPGIITQKFGSSHYVNGRKGTTHSGVDLRARTPTPVRAAHAGIVRLADFFRAFGGTVVIDHGHGVYSFYFHLSKIGVVNGSYVARGQRIGLTGNTGFSTGPHLHWGMSVHDVRVEPMQWLRQVF